MIRCPRLVCQQADAVCPDEPRAQISPILHQYADPLVCRQGPHRVIILNPTRSPGLRSSRLKDSREVDVGHVVLQQPRSAKCLERRIHRCNFDLTSVDNGIALCPTCHAEFDQTADPGFGLLPTDLQYFVDVELDGRQEQKLAMKNGKDIHRKVPTAEEYKIHQSNNGKVPTDAGGGLYRPIFLKNYLPGGDLSSHMLDTLSAPKQWHGAPVATLRRGILVLGGARVQSLDAESRSQLELLRDLYFLDDEETSPAVRSRQTQGVAQQGQKRPLDNEYGGQNKLSKSSNPAIESGNRRAADEGITLQQCPCGALNVPRRWTLGPGLTADEAVLRYAPLLKDMQSKE